MAPVPSHEKHAWMSISAKSKKKMTGQWVLVFGLFIATVEQIQLKETYRLQKSTIAN